MNEAGYCRCCNVSSMCGYRLIHGTIFIGFTTIVISFIILMSSVVSLKRMSSEEILYSKHLISGINMLFSLFASSISVYQIMVSAFLVWQGVSRNGDIFISSVWYTSHLSILICYFIMFAAKTIACLFAKETSTAVTTIIEAIVYEGVFIYFMIIVNSHLNLLIRERC